VGDLVASYYGTQRLTRDNCGGEVYGGTDLVVTRGGFDALGALDLPDDVQLAVRQARTYDAAATGCFPGLIASRRNYDPEPFYFPNRKFPACCSCTAGGAVRRATSCAREASPGWAAFV
jgi:hypothetical protein